MTEAVVGHASDDGSLCHLFSEESMNNATCTEGSGAFAKKVCDELHRALVPSVLFGYIMTALSLAALAIAINAALMRCHPKAKSVQQ